MALTQTPENEMVGRSISAVDFFVILAGDLLGKLVASIDTLGAWNTLIGIPVGVLSAQYMKHLRFKEFLMGFGIGMVDGGIQRFTTGVADYVNANIGFTTLDAGIKNWLQSIGTPAQPTGTTVFNVYW
jgi:hypothetical protein